MRFNSKRDSWMGIIIALCEIGLGWMVVEAFLDKENSIIAPLIIFGLFTVFVASIWFGTYYVINENTLIIRYGFYKKIITIEEIQSLQLTTNPFIATTLSRFKIDIIYGKYNLATVSPNDREAFIQELQKRNSTIQIKN